MVRNGAIVIFDASRLVMSISPDTVNIHCIRRNIQDA
jgi:hypothetical protein